MFELYILEPLLSFTNISITLRDTVSITDLYKWNIVGGGGCSTGPKQLFRPAPDVHVALLRLTATVDVTSALNNPAKRTRSVIHSARVPEMLFTVSARRSPWRRPHLRHSSQLVSLGLLGLLLLSGAQLVLGDLAVLVLVLVVEHVLDDAVGVDPRTEATFPLFDLELDEG